jgi:hypothetical protein
LEQDDWYFDILSGPLSAFFATLRFDSSSLSDDRQHLGDFRAVVFMRAGAVLNLIIGNTDDCEIAIHVVGLRQGLITQLVAEEAENLE